MTSLNIVVIAVLSVYTLFILIPVLVLLLEKKEDVRHSELVSESQQMLNQVRHEDRKEKLSIIIPFRNEAHTIINCLKGITEQDFPKELTQIILVDDSSEDNTTQIAESFLKEKKVAYTLINLKEHNLYKVKRKQDNEEIIIFQISKRKALEILPSSIKNLNKHKIYKGPKYSQVEPQSTLFPK